MDAWEEFLFADIGRKKRITQRRRVRRGAQRKKEENDERK